MTSSCSRGTLMGGSIFVVLLTPMAVASKLASLVARILSLARAPYGVTMIL
ncbi:unnamed protein product [Periconia digitata]|uniref:Uncharacterized protein n=1 Tax=Periconia digitata TaxID=1303443 RepID=A0A9W4XJK0_9PLEO|nr:unnamed protein product [Periconia digitata]